MKAAWEKDPAAGPPIQKSAGDASTTATTAGTPKRKRATPKKVRTEKADDKFRPGSEDEEEEAPQAKKRARAPVRKIKTEAEAEAEGDAEGQGDAEAHVEYGAYKPHHAQLPPRTHFRGFEPETTPYSLAAPSGFVGHAGLVDYAQTQAQAQPRTQLNGFAAQRETKVKTEADPEAERSATANDEEWYESSEYLDNAAGAGAAVDDSKSFFSSSLSVSFFWEVD